MRYWLVKYHEMLVLVLSISWTKAPEAEKCPHGWHASHVLVQHLTHRCHQASRSPIWHLLAHLRIKNQERPLMHISCTSSVTALSQSRYLPVDGLSSHTVFVSLTDDKLGCVYIILLGVGVVDASVESGAALRIITVTVGLDLPRPVRTCRVVAREATIRSTGATVIWCSRICDKGLVSVHNCSDHYCLVRERDIFETDERRTTLAEVGIAKWRGRLPW